MPPSVVDALTEFARFVITLAAVVAAIGIIAKAPFVRRPTRWLFRNLIGDPVAGWFRGEVTSIIRLEVPALVDERLDRRPLTNGKGWQTVQEVQETVQQIADAITDQQDDHHEPGS